MRKKNTNTVGYIGIIIIARAAAFVERNLIFFFFLHLKNDVFNTSNSTSPKTRPKNSRIQYIIELSSTKFCALYYVPWILWIMKAGQTTHLGT